MTVRLAPAHLPARGDWRRFRNLGDHNFDRSHSTKDLNDRRRLHRNQCKQAVMETFPCKFMCFVSCISFFVAPPCSGQGRIISGVVLDETDTPIAGASLILEKQNGQSIGSTTTNSTGSFF
jgi:hypothetical protein